MRFGIHLIQQNITLAECRELWRWADTAGFNWFDVSDHFYESPMTEKRGPYLECLTCLATLACDTQHMRIGTVVLAMDYRHPAVLANALAAIDQLSDGRLEPGFGAGWNEIEYSAYGIPFERIGHRLDVLEEGIQVHPSAFRRVLGELRRPLLRAARRSVRAETVAASRPLLDRRQRRAAHAAPRRAARGRLEFAIHHGRPVAAPQQGARTMV